jgi:Rieske Fe-S protein
MIESSRRQFLAATGAGAVAVGAAAIVPATTASAAKAPASLEADLFEGADGAVPVIVSVEDPAAGLLSVMHGENEFTVTDPDLAARITRLATKEA